MLSNKLHSKKDKRALEKGFQLAFISKALTNLPGQWYILSSVSRKCLCLELHLTLKFTLSEIFSTRLDETTHFDVLKSWSATFRVLWFAKPLSCYKKSYVVQSFSKNIYPLSISILTHLLNLSIKKQQGKNNILFRVDYLCPVLTTTKWTINTALLHREKFYTTLALAMSPELLTNFERSSALMELSFIMYRKHESGKTTGKEHSWNQQSQSVSVNAKKILQDS